MTKMRPRRISATAAALLLSTAVAVAQTATCGYMNYVAQQESGGNQWAAASGSTATGEYQMTQAALASVGLITQNSPPSSSNLGPNGNWNNVTFQPNQWGIQSRQDLMNNPQAQQALATQYEQQNWSALQRNGTAGLVGTQSPGGTNLNEAAILDCGYVLGAGGCHQYLTTGQLPANAPPGYGSVIEKRMAAASQQDASCVTNGQNTPVSNSVSSSGVNGGVNGNGATGFLAGGGAGDTGWYRNAPGYTAPLNAGTSATNGASNLTNGLFGPGSGGQMGQGIIWNNNNTQGQ